MAPWNKGLTKETDPRVAKYAASGAVTRREPKARAEAGIRAKKHMTEYYQNAENRERNSERVKQAWLDNPENFASSLKALKEANQKRGNGELPSGYENKTHTEAWKQNKSEAMQKLWEDKEYSQKVMARREKSGPELQFENMVLENTLPYEFVGFHTFKVGSKNPDFLHTTEKKVIEIYGDYFHKGHDPQDRIDYFKQYGYACLVIWASELKNTQSVLERVNSFTNEVL